MKPVDLFPEKEQGALEESIRVDREIGDEEKLKLLRDYHVTEESEEFIEDFLQRTLGKSEQKRRGWNHWLYGYYGSGKSHLLAVLGNLTDSVWIDEIGRDRVWESLTEGTRDLSRLRDLWEETLDAYHLKPLFINLLKHQGREEQGLNEILLGEAHLEEGLSRRLDVAYFERWYKNHGSWESRDEDARRVLESVGIEDLPGTPWSIVQKYRVVSDLVLPSLFADEAGTSDGLKDLRPSQLKPSEVLSELEEWRNQIREEVDRPVKLVLLLDEVSLFIGTDYEQLTELQLVAEKIDDVGQGNILSVATAQERIEHVQPEYAGKSPDFGILKDRFPHRYLLPSRHVGEIVENRLLSKSTDQRDRLREALKEAPIRPEDTFIYSNVQQNTEPPLDELTYERFLDFYPLLPFHPPLFMEILSNLRGQDVDRAKSIFSGTARAILALVDGLLVNWRDDREISELVNLVDFYEVIRPELEKISPMDVKAIDDIQAEADRGKLEEFDVDIARGILLLHYATDMISIVDHQENIAVSVMRDLEGQNRIAMGNRVGDAINRLDKYLGPQLEFRPPEQREIYEKAQRYEDRGDWDELFGPVGEKLWKDVVQYLDLPDTLTFPGESDSYPVTYTFEVDGRSIEGKFGADEGLHVPVVVEGVVPADTDTSHQDKLLWRATREGRPPVRDALIRWAALSCAMEGRPPQEAVKQDLEERRNEASRLVSDLLGNGSFQVRERTTRNRGEALEWVLERRYPGYFHPIMFEVGDRHLRELSKLSASDDLPRWAIKLEVPTEDPATHTGDIQAKVRALTGISVKGSGKDQLTLSRLLELISEKEQFYEGVKPALAAIIWGLCRKGDFLTVNQQGNPVSDEAVLDPKQWSEVSIRISDLRGGFREAVEKIPGIDQNDSNTEKLVELQEFLQDIRQDIENLEEDVDVTRGTVRSSQVGKLLDSLSSTLKARGTGSKNRLNQLGKSGTDWNTFIDGAIDDQGWVKDVSERWSRRRSFLLHLEALVLFTEAEVPWVDESAQNALGALRDELRDASSAEWWTSQGWKQFVTALPSRNRVLETLQTAWEEYREEEGREALAHRIEKHDWAVQSLQLPPSRVHQAFQNEVLSPLRDFQRAFEEEKRRASRLLKDPSESEYREIVWLIDHLAEPGQRPYAPTVTEGRELMEQLDGIVDDRHYDDIQGIGLLPDDAQVLRSNLEEIDDPDELSLRHVDGGVVIE